MNNKSFLPDLIDVNQYETFNEFIEELFYILYNQFFVEKIRFNGKFVKINKTPLKCTQNDNCNSVEYSCNHCPFQGKYERFNHIVTGLNENTRTPGKYKESRAIRVHWIKYIIENVQSEKILYFKKGTKHYFWAKYVSYIVIIKETPKGDYYLITAFYIDDKTYEFKFEKDYLIYNNLFKNEKDSP